MQQIPLDASAVAGTDTGSGVIEIRPDVAYRSLTLVNVAFIGPVGAVDRDWLLVDAGLSGSEPEIVAAAAHRFGAASRPAAIVLTHAHFDHVGAVLDLSERWDVPVFAHPLEHPYLDGSARYPAPDPKVGGGLMSLLSPIYERGPIDLGDRLRALPEDGSLPKTKASLFHAAASGAWRWLHMPGHSVGHVSLWREVDRTLLAADAVITTAQESAYAVAMSRTELHGPPMYFTHDWAAARGSVERLAALQPDILLSGHGRAVAGPAMRQALHDLSHDFDSIAYPADAHYLLHPARAEDGSAYVAPD